MKTSRLVIEGTSANCLWLDLTISRPELLHPIVYFTIKLREYFIV
ncbi:hypothetical protein [Paenibacillus taichungensis]